MQETNLIEQGQSADAIASEIAAAAPTMTLCSYGNKLTREELASSSTLGFRQSNKVVPRRFILSEMLNWRAELISRVGNRRIVRSNLT